MTDRTRLLIHLGVPLTLTIEAAWLVALWRLAVWLVWSSGQ